MQFELTPEHVMEIGKLWGDAFLSTLSNEKKLELVKDIPVHERFKDVSIDKKLELVKDIPVHERLKDVPVHEKLKNVSVHERLKDVSIDTIETILNMMKQQGKK